jgi:sporulation inhibitor KapD
MNEVLISGRILSFDEQDRIIAIRHNNKIKIYYLQRSMLNQIGKYIVVGRFIQFYIKDEYRQYRGRKVYTVEYIMKIMAIRFRKNIVFYDYKKIQSGTKSLINNLKYKMFLDLEMSMHPFKKDPHFKQEIIQVGIHMVDENNKFVFKYNQVIQPTIHKKLTKRTLKFLTITQEDVNHGIPFSEFYETFKKLIEEYDPAIIVWGRNDFLAFREAYKINKLPSLRNKTRYINLLKLHRNFYNLKNDLGLFNALKLYEDAPDPQTHNAYEDAYVTYMIFKGFKKVVNGKLSVDLSEYK